jgi:hypothetical protein
MFQKMASRFSVDIINTLAVVNHRCLLFGMKICLGMTQEGVNPISLVSSLICPIVIQNVVQRLIIGCLIHRPCQRKFVPPCVFLLERLPDVFVDIINRTRPDIAGVRADVYTPRYEEHEFYKMAPVHRRCPPKITAARASLTSCRTHTRVKHSESMRCRTVFHFPRISAD